MMSRMNFKSMLAKETVNDLAEMVKDIYTWESSLGIQAQTAAITIAMREVENTTRRLDEAATRLQQSSLALAGVSLVVSIAALVVSFVK